MPRPLFLLAVLVGSTDLVSTVNSSPTILAIAQGRLSPIRQRFRGFPRLGALFFLLVEVVHKSHLHKLKCSAVLVLVGEQVLLVDVYPVPRGVCLS